VKLTTPKPRIAGIANRVKVLTANPNATPRQRGRAGMSSRDRVLSANPLCAHCKTRAATEADHIVRLVDGGADTDENKQGLCYWCHKDKTQREARR
jgi:5-methylcytosine-specific restriction protein A